MTFGSGACGCLGHGNSNDVSQVCLHAMLSLCVYMCVCVYHALCSLLVYIHLLFARIGSTNICLQCYDAVGWAARRASGL